MNLLLIGIIIFVIVYLFLNWFARTSSKRIATTIKKIAVLGGGSFGTVLANIAASNGYDVSLWVRDSDQALRINSEGANSTYHPELQLSPNIAASEILEDVIKDSAEHYYYHFV